MAQGHSIDEYLETIYFLAFPIGEYKPHATGSPTLSTRVARTRQPKQSFVDRGRELDTDDVLIQSPNAYLKSSLNPFEVRTSSSSPS